MKFFGIYVCIAALAALWSHQTKREHTKSLHQFTCRTVKDIAYLGMIVVIGFPLFCLQFCCSIQTLNIWSTSPYLIHWPDWK